MSQASSVITPTPTPHPQPSITPETACDPAYLLFQQALVERSERAWETLYAHYLPLVVRWVRQEPAFDLCAEEAQDFANRAFAKLWRSITPARFGKFANTAALLHYLHLCVRSVVVDQGRTDQQRQREVELLVDDRRLVAGDLAQRYYADLDRQAFWQRVQTHVRNEQERQLLYDRFVLGNKPRHIWQQHSETFASPDEVYTLLQKILTRLRRDPGLQQFVHNGTFRL